MKDKSAVLKKIAFFTLIMAIICLIYMVVSNLVYQKSRIVIDLDTMELVQLNEPKADDTVAVIDTSLGEVKAVLYPQYAPNAVKNFIDLAESGYYDNTYVFHSENGLYSAAGSPDKSGILPDGYNKSCELIKREVHQNLWPFKGALCCLSTAFEQTFWQRFTGNGTYYCGSRFALLNSIEMTDEISKQIREQCGSEELTKAFAEKGGVPDFSQKIVIIGQAYEGLDVIEALSTLETTETDGASKTPVDDVMINSVKITTYAEAEADTKQ